MKAKSKYDVQAHVLKAQQIWDGMNSSEKFGCQFGLFPSAPMDEAEEEGYDSKVLVHELMHRSNAVDRKKRGLT